MSATLSAVIGNLGVQGEVGQLHLSHTSRWPPQPPPKRSRKLHLDQGRYPLPAAAPVIGANGEDVAASIAFTAVLGVLVVLGLPLLVPLLGLAPMQYGVLAG